MSSTCVITFTIELTRDGASIDFNQTDFGNGPAHVTGTGVARFC